MGAKNIAVLTSGGDAPGMNAAVRAVVRTGINFGMKVYGVKRGYNGLLGGDLEEMNMRSVSDIMQHGGTALFTARSPEFNTPEGVKKAADMCRKLDIDGLVVIGGDGSFRGARDLTGEGILTIGVPGTIDNDIACTDYTIGYDTALNTAMEMIDRIRDTTESHDRCSVVEVMGRRCGDIALNVGVAAGAIATLVPEVPFDFEKDIIGRIRTSSWWQRAWVTPRRSPSASRRRPASRAVPPFWAMCSVVVLPLCVTVLWPAVWDIMLWIC